MALGQCLRRRWNTPCTNVCAALIDAASRGDDYLHLALQYHRISEAWVWCHPPQGYDRRKREPVPEDATIYPPPSHYTRRH